MSEIEIVVKCCNDELDLYNAKLSDEYHYESLSLCAIDAVFSIGVRYASTRQTVIKYCDFYGMKRIRDDFNSIPRETEQESISQLVDKIGNKGVEEFTNEVLKNRQRTSPRSGILKTDAVLRFAKILKEFNVEYLQDIYKIINNEKFEEEIKEIPGQKSGISLKYFFMLAGSSDFIKPDRMIIRFLENILRRKVELKEAQSLLREASEILKVQFLNMTPRILDHEIWKKMSSTNYEEQRAPYDMKSKILKDEISPLNEAKQQKAIEIAKNLLDILNDETIAIKTGLDIEQIKKLRKENI